MRISSITKNAGKACNNRLYRHIRTFEKIVKNYFVIYLKTIGNFLLKHGDGELTLDKKAIEGMVRSHLHEDEFIHSPKVNVKATKNKIAVNVKGELKRTSALIGKTGTLMKEIENEVQHILGTKEPVKVSVKYTGFEEPAKRSNDRKRVE